MAITTWLGIFVFLLAALGSVLLARQIRLRWMLALALRLVLLAVVMIGFMLGIEKSDNQSLPPEILIIDQSESVTEQARLDAKVFATAWKEARENRSIITFGTASEVILSDDWASVDAGGSDLNAALQVAEELLGGQQGNVLVMTDGLVEDTVSLRDTLIDVQSNGNHIAYIRMATQAYQNDLYMGEIRGSSAVWEGTQFAIQVPIIAPEESAGKLASVLVLVNGKAYTQLAEFSLKAGENVVEIPFQAGASGVMEIEVRVVQPDDPFSGNDVAYSAVQVYPKPKVLFITTAEREADMYIRKLAGEGVSVEVVSPGEVPGAVSGLDAYQAIILHNILSQDLSLEQMENIRLHVVEKGMGLVILGGRNSYTLGGYQNSILEPLIPVRLAPPDRVERVPVTFLLVLDRSGSMAGDRDTDIAPIDLTREGAMRAVETLRSDDYLGVITFSGVTTWEVEIGPVGEGLALREAQDKISQIEAYGGTFMYNALETAVNALLDTDTTDYPHILLMSDGETDRSDDEFTRLAQLARSNGITISTIALGSESDPEALSLIAQAGGGRFYQVLNPVDLPEVMISESRAIQAENVQEGVTNAVLNIDGHPILSDIRLDQMPRLSAYVAVQSKASLGAEDVLVSGNYGDPLLAVWQVGLGHVAAWMGDIGEGWVPEMKTWDAQGQFWAQVVRYTLPSPTLGESYVAVGESDKQVTVGLAFDPTTAGSLTGDVPLMALASEQGGVSTYRLSQMGPSEFTLNLDKPEMGAYSGLIQYNLNGERQQLFVPFAVNYPAEWQFEGPEAATEAFNTLLAASGNQETTVEAALAETFDANEPAQFDWYGFILIVLVLSWPAEVAIRRWQMPWRRP